MRTRKALLAGLLVVALAAAALLPSVILRRVEAQITSVRDASAAFIKDTVFLTSLARTASGDSGSPVDLAAYDSGVILINVTAVSGTSPTLTVNFENCEDSTTTLCGYVHTASSSITGTGKTAVKVNQIGRYVRIGYTIGGTTPSFTFTVRGVFKPST